MQDYWMIVAAVYIAVSIGLMVYGLHCYAMIGLFLLRQKRHRGEIAAEVAAFNLDRAPGEYPLVTVQLPVYNEAEVVERLMWSAAQLDYPADRFEIQVLDDSNDETCEIIDRTAAAIRETGIDVSVARRADRRHFKAGALAAGLETAKGEFAAIFDSDFIVPPNFLKRSVALIAGIPDVACVQGRWGHANREENWLTKAQSVGIDGHFTAEQGARGYSGFCLNFNGTAGIWRVSAIAAAGGWQGDTLTEDLDLSYRAQLAGYRIRYDFDLECPAEIPNNVVALKSQQKRWAKGSIETARKLLPRILRHPGFTWLQKLEAFLHLTHYFVAVLMSIMCVLALPMIIMTPSPKIGWLLAIIWLIIGVSALAPCVMYTGSGLALERGFLAFRRFPAMLAMGMGLCLNNALAVLEAVWGYRTEFIRTPKSGSTAGQGRKGRYKADSSLILGVVELLLGVYCFYTFGAYLKYQKFLFGFFIAAYAVGLFSFGWLTLKHRFGTR